MFSSTPVASRPTVTEESDVSAIEKYVNRMQNSKSNYVIVKCLGIGIRTQRRPGTLLPSTVLIVDDEPAILDLARMILEDGGFSVVTAKDGMQALREAEEHRPDLVLLDLVMPGISGVETCKALKSRAATRRVPVVMFTVLGAESDRKRAENVHCDGYLVKPFTPEALLTEVQKYVIPQHM